MRPKKIDTLRNNINYVPGTDDYAYHGSGLLRFSCVGILERRKNQQFLIELMQEINASPAQLNLYGVGPDEAMLRELVRKENLEERIHFMGWVEADKIYNNTDLILMPSLHEGAPNAVLEALEKGVPILASDLVEHREVLPNSNLIALDDRQRWLQRLLEIISRPKPELRGLYLAQLPVARALCFDWDQKFCDLVLVRE